MRGGKDAGVTEETGTGKRAGAASAAPQPAPLSFAAFPAIGFFGGTFDPIHYGHLRLAEEMGDALELGQVLFVPSGRPPHREQPRVAAHDRLEMVRRAVAGNPLFAVDDREMHRPAPSYSVDTLTALRSEWGERRRVWMLLGGDAFHGLPHWHDWRRLFELVNIAVAARPASPALQIGTLPDALRDEVRMRQVTECDEAGPAGSVYFRQTTALDISATALRAALARQRSVRYLLPDAVLDYMDEHQLYRTI